MCGGCWFELAVTCPIEDPEAPQPAPRPVQARQCSVVVGESLDHEYPVGVFEADGYLGDSAILLPWLQLSSLRWTAEWWWHFQLRFGTEQLAKEFCPEAV